MDLVIFDIIIYNTTEFTEFTEKHKLDGLQKRDRDLKGPYYTDAKKQRHCL